MRNQSDHGATTPVEDVLLGILADKEAHADATSEERGKKKQKKDDMNVLNLRFGMKGDKPRDARDASLAALSDDSEPELQSARRSPRKQAVSPHAVVDVDPAPPAKYRRVEDGRAPPPRRASTGSQDDAFTTEMKELMRNVKKSNENSDAFIGSSQATQQQNLLVQQQILIELQKMNRSSNTSS